MAKMAALILSGRASFLYLFTDFIEPKTTIVV